MTRRRHLQWQGCRVVPPRHNGTLSRIGPQSPVQYHAVRDESEEMAKKGSWLKWSLSQPEVSPLGLNDIAAITVEAPVFASRMILVNACMEYEEQRVDWPRGTPIASDGQGSQPRNAAFEHQYPARHGGPEGTVHRIPRKPVPSSRPTPTSNGPFLGDVEGANLPLALCPINGIASGTTEVGWATVPDRQRESKRPTVLQHEMSTARDEPSYWNPFWLNRTFLVAFAFVLTTLAVLLLVLWRVCQNNHGFALVTRNHYAWTYGPTAILVLIVAMWRQSDFWSKALTPWQQMRSKYSDAEHSVLLDYLSPLLPVTIWHAMRAEHWMVALSSLLFILLKVAMVTSTGLFALQQTKLLNSEESLLSKTHFDATDFASATDMSPDYVGYSNTASRLLYETYAFMAADLAYPDGLTANAVYQSLDLPHSPDRKQNVTYSAEVEAFYPDMNCEPATVAWLFGNDTSIRTPAPHIKSASCPETKRIYQPIEDVTSRVLPSRLLFRTETWQLECSAGAWEGPNRVFLGIADVRYQQTWDGVDLTSYSVEVAQVTGVICKPRYSIERTNVTYHRNGDHQQEVVRVAEPHTASGKQLSGLTGLDLYRELASTISVSNYQVAKAADGGSVYIDGGAGGIMGFGPYLLNLQYEALLDVSTLLMVADTTFRSLSNQIVRQSASKTSNDTIKGTVIREQDRLFIRTAPMWTIIGVFSALVMLLLIFIIRRPANVVPWSVEATSGHIPTLANSRDLQDILTGAGNFNSKRFRERLREHQFRSGWDLSRFSIMVTGARPKDSPLDKNMQIWWRPLTSHWAMRSLSFGLPIAVIIILEVLQRRSDKHHGVAAIGQADGVSSVLLTRIIPAVVMVVIANLFNSLEFTLSVLAPFHSMKRHQQPFGRGIGSSILGRTPFGALYYSIKKRYHAAALAIMAALLGSILTVVSSGLYTLEVVTYSQTLDLVRLDQFDLTQVSFVGGANPAAALSSLVENSVTSYPSFSWGELAIPRIKLSETAAKLTADLREQQAMFDLRLPVLRASLACNFSPADSEKITASVGFEYGYDLPDTTVHVHTRAELPLHCQRGGEGGNLTYLDWGWVVKWAPNDTYIGTVQDLDTGPWAKHAISAAGESDDWQDNPPGCPSLGLAFGHVLVGDETGNLASPWSDMTIMTCYQLIQEVDATVSFTLPGLQISSASPPIVHESTAQYLGAGPNGELAFQYRIQPNLDGMLYMFNNKTYANPTGAVVSTFHQAMLFGRTPTIEASLIGPDNHERLFNASQAYYRRYVAQVISQNMRTTITPSTGSLTTSSSSPATELTGTYYNPLHSARVYQNNASKLALQIIHGVMVVCAALAYSMSDMSHTLPHNPCSIAGTMNLIAGSEMCSSPEAEPTATLGQKVESIVNGKELEQHGWLYSLGWWPAKTSQERPRYGIDIGKTSSCPLPAE